MTEDEVVGWHHQLDGTWVWASSGSWWWTGKPGVLQSMGLQTVGHNWATELKYSWDKCCESTWIFFSWFVFLYNFFIVQLLSPVWLFATPWTAEHQASLSITNSRSLLKFMSIEMMRPSSHLVLCHPLLLLPQSFPESGSFPMSHFFPSGDQSIGVSASASVLPMNIQGWFPLGLIGLISLKS